MSTTAATRHLIRPSVQTPWDVQVVGVVPEQVKDAMGNDNAFGCVATAATGWSAIATANGRFYVWSTHDNGNDDAFEPPKAHYLYHPSFAKYPIRFIALSSLSSFQGDADSNKQSSVCVYAWNEVTSQLFLWILKRGDSKVAASVKARVKVALQEGDSVSCLQAMNGTIVIGTTQGRLYSVAQTPLPIVLTVTPLKRSPSSGGERLWSYVFGASSGARGADAPIQSILMTSNSDFLSITSSGIIEHWTKSTTMTTSTFESSLLASLSKTLSNHKDDSVAVGQGLQVLAAAAREQQLSIVFEANGRAYLVQTVMDPTGLSVEHVHWLSRFHGNVDCVGLVILETDVVYATFQYPNAGAPVTCLAISNSNLQEVDLPVNECPRVVSGTIGPSIETNGCNCISTEGLVLRARRMQLQSSSSGGQHGNASSVAHLVKHLTAAFWQWYRSGATSVAHSSLPPSVHNASTADLEDAIVATALELQSQGDNSSLQNPMEWHKAFLKLLRQGGVYKSLSTQGRFALLGIGQELAVHQQLVASGNDLFQHLLPHGVASKLLGIQQYVLRASSEHGRWCQGLCLALDTAAQYRQEQSTEIYDVFGDETTKLWTHQSALQQVLVTELEYWRDHANVLKQLDPEQCKTVVKSALTSFQESRSLHYQNVKALAIPLVRLVDDDKLAFDLSKQHQWYEGLCILSFDHKNDDYFALDSLLSQGNEGFARFVLVWYADKGKYGQVIRLGRNVPAILSDFMESDDRLRPYRWIHAIDQDKYNLATEQLMENTTDANLTLEETRWALSMAKLSNKVSAVEHASKRRKVFDARLDLIRAQEFLLGNTSDPLQEPSQLFALAMDQLAKCTSGKDDAIQIGMVGLAVAKAMDHKEESATAAAQVWSKVIQKDWTAFQTWIKTSEDLASLQLRETVLTETIFGGLRLILQRQSGSDHEHVQYDRAMEAQVLGNLGLDSVATKEMTRLLRSVTRMQMQTKSLMISSIPTN